jgi:hypothetical protein
MPGGRGLDSRRHVCLINLSTVSERVQVRNERLREERHDQ